MFSSPLPCVIENYKFIVFDLILEFIMNYALIISFKPITFTRLNKSISFRYFCDKIIMAKINLAADELKGLPFEGCVSGRPF